LVHGERLLGALGDGETEQVIWCCKYHRKPQQVPMVSLLGVASALPLPSGRNRVSCTPHTASSAMSNAPGSGSMARPNATTIAGWCPLFRGGRKRIVAGSGTSMPRERKYVSAGVPGAGAAMRQSHRALPSCCSGPPTTGGGEGGLGAGRGRAGR